MRIIFLDMDGPLTNARVHIAYGDDGVWRTPDPVVIQYLNRLGEKFSDLRIVVSSHWRRLPGHVSSLPGMKEGDTVVEFLKHHGLTVPFHDDVFTEYFRPGGLIDPQSSRSTEILDWVGRNNPEFWASIDDAHLSLDCHPVEVDGMSGMTYEDFLLLSYWLEDSKTVGTAMDFAKKKREWKSLQA